MYSLFSTTTDAKHTLSMDPKQACDLLGVNRNCSLDELNQALEKLTLEVENDPKLALSGKQERQAQLRHAHQSLKDTKQQAQTQQQPQSVQCPPPLELLFELTLEEIYAGGPKNVQIHRRIWSAGGIVVRSEEATVSVPFPRGVKEDTRLVVSGQGDRYHGQRQPTDVAFTVRQLPHARFRRLAEPNTADLAITVTLSPWEAILEEFYETPVISGGKRRFYFDILTSLEATKREVGRGLPVVSTDNTSPETVKFGDLHVHFRVNFDDEDTADAPPKVNLLDQLPAATAELRLSLEELLHGCEKFHRLVVKETDKAGHTTEHESVVKVTVPPGPPEEIVLKGAGDCAHGKRPADVRFRVVAKPHAVFERTGDDHHTGDLYIAAPVWITARQAIAGGTVTVATLEDGSLKHRFRGGVQPGQKFWVPGAGLWSSPVALTSERTVDVRQTKSPAAVERRRRGDIIGRFAVVGIDGGGGGDGDGGSHFSLGMTLVDEDTSDEDDDPLLTGLR